VCVHRGDGMSVYMSICVCPVFLKKKKKGNLRIWACSWAKKTIICSSLPSPSVMLMKKIREKAENCSAFL
jgi:hypothetical protein